MTNFSLFLLSDLSDDKVLDELIAEVQRENTTQDMRTSARIWFLREEVLRRLNELRREIAISTGLQEDDD